MERLTFVTHAIPGGPVRQAVLLAASIREFGGDLAKCPIRIMVPEGTAGPIEGQMGDALRSHHAELVSFTVDAGFDGIPFASKVSAAAAAERGAAGDSDLLAWLDADTLVLQPPVDFLLPPTAALGFRPVHHRLIGTTWGEPIDPFWYLLFSVLDKPPGRRFPMTTHCGERIEAYFNAGSFVLRPQRGLLRQWLHDTAAAIGHPDISDHCERSQLHAVFLHQAVFTATLLRDLEPGEMHPFGPEINYPLHLHDEVPPAMRPAVVDDLTTARCEDTFSRPQWRERFPMSARLRRWLDSHIPPIPS
jgi:hypothetical protein